MPQLSMLGNIPKRILRRKEPLLPQRLARHSAWAFWIRFVIFLPLVCWSCFFRFIPQSYNFSSNIVLTSAIFFLVFVNFYAICMHTAYITGVVFSGYAVFRPISVSGNFSHFLREKVISLKGIFGFKLRNLCSKVRNINSRLWNLCFQL